MEIYLIRHTTPDIEKGICYGQSDLDLTKNYIKEFEQVIAKIPRKKHFKIYSSPLKRCALLSKQFNNQVTFDDRLKELDFGDWELKPWNKIPEEEINPWMNNFVNTETPNGESYVQLATRVEAFVNDFLALKTHQNIIVVSHAGPIRSILANLMNVPLKNSFGIKINYGDIFKLTNKNGKLKLITEINL